MNWQKYQWNCLKMVAVATVEKITKQITGKDKIEVPVVEVPVVAVEEEEEEISAVSCYCC